MYLDTSGLRHVQHTRTNSQINRGSQCGLVKNLFGLMALFGNVYISSVTPIVQHPRCLTARIFQHINKLGSDADGTLD